MIRCPFCQFTSDDCNVCNGFGWFAPDDPSDSLVDDVCEYDVCEYNPNIVPNPVTLKKAVEQDPIQALSILADWFDKTSRELSNTTGSYVFYRDIADLLVECKVYLQQLDRYERAISGENEPTCLMTMWESQQ